jgi:hypothetical protein
MKKFRIFLALLTNALLFGLILLVYLHGRNPYMEFLTSFSSKIYLYGLCLVGILSTCLTLADLRKRDR